MYCLRIKLVRRYFCLILRQYISRLQCRTETLVRRYSCLILRQYISRFTVYDRNTGQEVFLLNPKAVHAD